MDFLGYMHCFKDNTPQTFLCFLKMTINTVTRKKQEQHSVLRSDHRCLWNYTWNKFYTKHASSNSKAKAAFQKILYIWLVMMPICDTEMMYCCGNHNTLTMLRMKKIRTKTNVSFRQWVSSGSLTTQWRKTVS